jgi:hypothetical protein
MLRYPNFGVQTLQYRHAIGDISPRENVIASISEDLRQLCQKRRIIINSREWSLLSPPSRALL